MRLQWSVAQVSLKIYKLCLRFLRVKWMLSAEIISVLIKWTQWIKPDLNRLYYFILRALDGKERSHLKG